MLDNDHLKAEEVLCTENMHRMFSNGYLLFSFYGETKVLLLQAHLSIQVQSLSLLKDFFCIFKLFENRDTYLLLVHVNNIYWQSQPNG